MSLETELLRMMHQSVTVNPFSGKDGWNNPSYGAAVVYAARVQQKTAVVRTTDGREVTSRTQVYLATVNVIGQRDLITLPSGYLPQQPPIIEVSRLYDEEGGHHTVLYL